MPTCIIWWVFLTHGYIGSAGEMLKGLGIFTFIFATVAALVGWILQFPIWQFWIIFIEARRKMRHHRLDIALEPIPIRYG